MTRSSIPPEKIIQAIAMREAGHTTLGISQILGISTRSLHRIFARHGTTKGSIRQEVIDAARADLISRVTSNERIQQEAAQLIADDLAHVRQLREAIAAAAEKMRAADLRDAVLVMRAAAAYSTALKNTSDMLRHGMSLNRVFENDNEELPELTIRVLTGEQVQTLRDDQAGDSGEEFDSQEETEDSILNE